MKRNRWLLFVIVLVLGRGAWADTLIFAAASLTNVLNEIAAVSEKQTGKKVKVSYAASSILAKQIEAGAPAQIFVSADMDWMKYLDKRGLLAGGSHVIAGNKLVLIAPADSSATVTIGKGMNLKSLLGDGRLALGDPTSVPAGKYARAALEYYDEWSAVENNVIPLENVRVALVVVEEKEAPLGIVYATDAKVSPRVKVVGVFPEESHAPIVYPAALIKGKGDADAEAFYAFLQSNAAAGIFKKYGFIPPNAGD